MIKVDTASLLAFTERISGFARIKIIDLDFTQSTLTHALNTLTLYLQGFEGFITSSGHYLFKSTEGEGTFEITQSDLLEDLVFDTIDDLSTFTTVQNKTAGLLYSPYCDAPIYYDAPSGVATLANGMVITDTAKYLRNSRKLYNKHFTALLPKVALDLATKARKIKESQRARGFTDGIIEGLQVQVIPFDELAETYGQYTLEIYDGVSTEIAKKFLPTYGVAFIKSDLEFAGTYVIRKFNPTTGDVELSKEGEPVCITSLPIEQESIELSHALQIHETHLRR
jgi:hypothetical protein